MGIRVTMPNGEEKEITIPQEALAGDSNLELCDKIDNYLADNCMGNCGWSMK